MNKGWVKYARDELLYRFNKLYQQRYIDYDLLLDMREFLTCITDEYALAMNEIEKLRKELK